MAKLVMPFTQTDEAVTLVHNLGTRDVLVDVYGEDGLWAPAVIWFDRDSVEVTVGMLGEPVPGKYKAIFFT